VIETTAVRVMRLTDVNLDHALGEGEGYTSVAEWRAGHEQFWHSAEMRQALGDPAFTVGDDPLVVAQEFRLVEMSDEATRHNQAAYDQIAGLYAARQVERERGFRDLKAAFVARLPRVADIADLGCGPADDGALFAQAGHHVIGIDRSAGMLAYAARALSGLVLQADLRRLPVASQSIDGIWCCAALLHVAHDQTMAALREMRRILRPDGCLALVTAAGQGARLEPVPYAPGTQRWFFYRGAVQLEEQLRDAGLRVMTLTEETSSRHWLNILACAAG
jgi:SAM-dependent methyltransferase